MFFSTKYQQYKHKKDDAEKAKHVIIVSRLPKLVLYHLRQVFICGIFSLIMQNQSRILIKYHPPPNLPSRKIRKNVQTHLPPGRDVIIELPLIVTQDSRLLFILKIIITISFILKKQFFVFQGIFKTSSGRPQHVFKMSSRFLQDERKTERPARL